MSRYERLNEVMTRTMNYITKISDKPFLEAGKPLIDNGTLPPEKVAKLGKMLLAQVRTGVEAKLRTVLPSVKVGLDAFDHADAISRELAPLLADQSTVEIFSETLLTHLTELNEQSSRLQEELVRLNGDLESGQQGLLQADQDTEKVFADMEAQFMQAYTQHQAEHVG
ncbi:hypothetical protein PAPYR_359 [Paratrimastix pyriformis]|uniref:Uncharacterized protein n=1 Tax=Paratrimastix pyriformis TaxID=342808 RepID=A0ABQ8UYC9_9EUKA|nr:hypothetical protein PAPYR_359 [Paratrimastix pyriformis]